MAEEDITALQLKLEEINAMCMKLQSLLEKNSSRCKAVRDQLDALQKQRASGKLDPQNGDTVSAQVAMETFHLQELERSRMETQAKLQECEQQKRELQQRIDDMTAAPY